MHDHTTAPPPAPPRHARRARGLRWGKRAVRGSSIVKNCVFFAFSASGASIPAMAGTAMTAESWTVPESAGSHQRFLPTFPGGEAAEADALTSLRKALETAAVDGPAPLAPACHNAHATRAAHSSRRRQGAGGAVGA